MPWTLDEEELLRALVNDRYKWKTVAERLERTVSECRCKYQRMVNMPPARNNHSGAWSDADTKQLARECARGLDWPRIAGTMRRSVKSCRDRWRLIRPCLEITPEEKSALISIGWSECARRYPSRSNWSWKLASTLL